MSVWLYKINRPFSYQHPELSTIDFENTWLTIRDGQLTIASEYAWDGCSPKISLFGLWTIGTPDGALRYGKPWTYYASLVHDVLCQFRHEHPLTQKQVTTIFQDMLTEVHWPWRKVYVWAVDYLGPQDFASDNPEKNKRVKVN